MAVPGLQSLLVLLGAVLIHASPFLVVAILPSLCEADSFLFLHEPSDLSRNQSYCRCQLKTLKTAS